MIQRRFPRLTVLAAAVLAAGLAVPPPAAVKADGMTASGPADTAEPLPLTAQVQAVPASGQPLPALTGVAAPGPLSAPSAILMEVLTGQVLDRKGVGVRKGGERA